MAGKKSSKKAATSQTPVVAVPAPPTPKPVAKQRVVAVPVTEPSAGDSQPGPQDVQQDTAEATTSQHASEPGSMPDSRTPPSKK